MLINHTSSFILFLLAYFCIGACSSERILADSSDNSKAYYLDNDGNDSNSGNKNSPWKTIDRLNKADLEPGDTILFKGGQTFFGNILISAEDAGRKGKEIILTSSGNGKAIINAGNMTAITVGLTGFIHISQLSLIGSGRKNGNTKDGLSISNSHHVLADSLEIQGFQKSGVLVNTSAFIDIIRIYAHGNGYAGISATGSYGQRDCSDITIRRCTAENNPGDPTNFENHSGNGIVAGFCRNVLMEECVAFNNGWDMPRTGNGPIGIWCYEADSVIIQKCISYSNKTSAGAEDGGGFDLDGGVKNSLIQYCLSYNNYGSGYALFQYAGASDWHNNTVRFNVSVNDGNVSTAQAGVFVWNSAADAKQFSSSVFHNNTIYNEGGAAIAFANPSDNKDFHFYNNIFIGRDTLIKGSDSTATFLGNNWWSLRDQFNIHGRRTLTEWTEYSGKEIYKNQVRGWNVMVPFPMNNKPLPTDPSDLPDFDNYKLTSATPFFNKGMDLLNELGINAGPFNFNYQPAPGPKNIGASF